MLELDIVARVERTILVVEVRYRGPNSFTTGLSSLSHEKRKRIRTAGQRLWDRRYRKDETVDHMRFDAAIVTYQNDSPIVEYVVAAF